jgi:hypothetical protein
MGESVITYDLVIDFRLSIIDYNFLETRNKLKPEIILIDN